MRQVVKVQHVADSEAIWIWGKATRTFHAKAFSVCIWNIWKQFGGAKFKKEYLELAAKSDILLCQEALISLDEIQFFNLKNFETAHAATYRRLDGKRDGVMTLSRACMAAEPSRIISLRPSQF